MTGIDIYIGKGMDGQTRLHPQSIVEGKQSRAVGYLVEKFLVLVGMWLFILPSPTFHPMIFSLTLCGITNYNLP